MGTEIVTCYSHIFIVVRDLLELLMCTYYLLLVNRLELRETHGCTHVFELLLLTVFRIETDPLSHYSCYSCIWIETDPLSHYSHYSCIWIEIDPLSHYSIYSRLNLKLYSQVI